MLEQIIDIVRRAGDMVLSAHDIQNVTREKHGPADLVTQYDEAVQVFLRQELLKLLPEASRRRRRQQTGFRRSICCRRRSFSARRGSGPL